MADTNRPVKLLFATPDYGIGTEALDVDRVCHIGPPSSLECKYYGKITFILKIIEILYLSNMDPCGF